MTSGSVGSPPSRNWTEWVKLSWLVHVTVAPVGTATAAGANRYDAGRSTWFVATGDAPPADAPLQPAMVASTAIAASTTATADAGRPRDDRELTAGAAGRSACDRPATRAPVTPAPRPTSDRGSSATRRRRPART